MKKYLIVFFIFSPTICSAPLPAVFNEPLFVYDKDDFKREKFTFRNKVEKDLETAFTIKHDMQFSHAYKMRIVMGKKLRGNSNLNDILKKPIKTKLFILPSHSKKILSCFLYFKKLAIRKELKIHKHQENKKLKLKISKKDKKRLNYMPFKTCQFIVDEKYKQLKTNALSGEAIKALWLWTSEETENGIFSIKIDTENYKSPIIHLEEKYEIF